MDRPHRATGDREPDPVDLAFLEQQMADAAISAANVGDEEHFAIFERDDGRVVAGASYIIPGGDCRAHVVWVAAVVASAMRSWRKSNMNRGHEAAGS